MKNLLFLLPMTFIGSICLWINYKLKINKKIYNSLKFIKPHYQILFYLLMAVILAVIVTFICDDILHVSENTAKIVQGSFLGIVLFLLPTSCTTAPDNK